MLKPVLSFVAVAKDGTSVTLKDSTGAYADPGNLGGYGAPNPVQPTLIGVRWRYWADDLPYANKIISNIALIAELLGTGRAFTYEDLGLVSGTFATGVHQVQYYPFEVSAHTVSAVQGSRKLTITAGTAPSGWDPAYKAAVLLDANNVPVSKVLLIDRLQPLTSTEFYVDTEWTDVNTAGLKLQLATEADLKVLVTASAEACLTKKIATIPGYDRCDHELVNHLTDLVTWKFAADVKFQCKDYSGAHNLIVAVEKQCAPCNTVLTCKTCAS